jgi:uncharacterized Zn finger protein (UPF0148 family)
MLGSDIDLQQNSFTSTPETNIAERSAPGDSVTEGRIDEPDLPASLEEMKMEYDRKHGKARESISSKLGERMLKGWTLLGTPCPNENCPGTPLMSNKGGPMLCVGCERSYEQDDSGRLSLVDKLRTQSVATSSLLTSTPVGSFGSPDRSTGPTIATLGDAFPMDDAPTLTTLTTTLDDPDPSALMGKKLLIGWAMLDSVCDSHPRMPLMRDLEGRKVCIDCQIAGMGEGNAKKPRQSNTANTDVKQGLKVPFSGAGERKRPAADDDTSKKTSMDTAPVSTEDTDLDSIDENAVFTQYRAQRMNELAKAQRRKTSKAQVTTSSSSSRASNVLETKLSDLTDGLEDTDDVVTISLIADAISKVAGALDSLRRRN